MNIGRSAIGQALMRPLIVVELEVVVQTRFQSRDRRILLDIEVLVFDAAPEALDKDIVKGAPAPVHTDADVGGLQFVAVTVLVPLGFSHDQVLVYIIAFQALIYSVVVIWGRIGLWQMNSSPRTPNAWVKEMG